MEAIISDLLTRFEKGALTISSGTSVAFEEALAPWVRVPKRRTPAIKVTAAMPTVNDRRRIFTAPSCP